MSHCGLIGLIKLSPVHILNVSGNLPHRSRNVPSPTDAGRTPSASCLGGRSLILRSLRPASVGLANIIHVIVSCCALFSFVLSCSLSGGDGLPCALFTCGADCPLVAVMRAFFFITRPWPFAIMAAAFGTLRAKGHESRQFDPPVGRDKPAAFPFYIFLYFSPSGNLSPRAPAHPLSVNKKRGGA